jgi:hypothetical protein
VKVTVVYAADAAQDCVPVSLPEGSTAAEAIRRSGLETAWGLDLTALVLAVRGHAIAAHARIADGDRIELLRPISADPKEARRRRATARARADIPPNVRNPKRG